MRKSNPVRYSSAVGEMWVHATFKVKYCHPIFDIEDVRLEADKLFKEACNRYSIPYKNIGFDDNHVHSILDINNYSRPEAAKMLRGYIAKKLLARFPRLKKKYFWNSGLWNPAYYMDAVGKDMDFMQKYVSKQKYAKPAIVQMKLTAY